jgi:hypothetical protein
MKNQIEKTISLTKVSLSIIILLITACKKNGASVPNFPLSPVGLTYIQLNTGRYFIYRDSAASKIDSVVVTESSFQPYTATSTDFGSTSTFTSQQYTLQLTEIVPTSGYVWLSGRTQEALLGQIYLSAADGHLLFEYVDPVMPAVIPSLVVEGKTYTDVNFTSGTGIDSSTHFNYYWAKGVGLIKRIERVGGVTNIYTLLRNN